MSRPINFTDTTVIKKPYVEIDGTEYEVQDGTYEGGTDLNANTFNKMQDELNQFRNLFSTHLIQMNTDYRTAASFVKVKPNTTYIFSSKDNNVNFQGNLIFYNSNQVQISQIFTFTAPFTTPSDCEWIKVTFNNENAPLDAKIQLEEGTEKTSYVPYIPENVENAINEAKKNYSIDEKKIGTWINGKPIYQKTFTYTPDLASRCLYQHGISNIDQIINSEAMLQKTNGQFVPLSMVYPNTTDLNTLITWSSGYQITKTDIETWIGNNMFEQMDTTNYGIIVTIQYTKTTD